MSEIFVGWNYDGSEEKSVKMYHKNNNHKILYIDDKSPLGEIVDFTLEEAEQVIKELSAMVSKVKLSLQ